MNCSPIIDPLSSLCFCQLCRLPMAEAEVRECSVDEAKDENQPAPPALVTKAVSLATTIGVFIADGCRLSGVAVAASRLEICRSCEWFKENECRDCGCYMPAKVYIASASCPLKPPKWGPVESID